MSKDKYQPKNYDNAAKMRLFFIVLAFLILGGIIYWVLQPVAYENTAVVQPIVEDPILAVNDEDKTTKIDTSTEPLEVEENLEKEVKIEEKPAVVQKKEVIKKEKPKSGGINESEALILVDEMATPKSGYEAYYRYIKNNLKYPEQAIKEGVHGNVTVEFIVDKEGNLHNIKIKRSIGHDCDEEAMRVVREGEKWKPAKNKGQVVMQKITLPISFKLNDSDKIKN
ncbi:MAG: energy transducer TonB [Thermoflexibacter sp.]|jgi:protein TonB|nr:energy transducer TonB [Thermoflexibacter sp.]